MAEALEFYRCVFAFSTWHFEQCHRGIKRAPNNHRSIDISLTRHALAPIRSVVEMQLAEEWSATKNGTLATLDAAILAQQYHGAPHPGLFAGSRDLDIRLEYYFLNPKFILEWPLVPSKKFATVQLKPADVAAVSAAVTAAEIPAYGQLCPVLAVKIHTFQFVTVCMFFIGPPCTGVPSDVNRR